MSSLDKVLALSQTADGHRLTPPDPAGELVLAASDAAQSLLAMLTGSLDDAPSEHALRKRAEAAALCEAVTVALAGLAQSEQDWVELTAFDERAFLVLAGSPKMPYGDVQYADPGYQADGKKRYPVDTEEHVRAAWSYINQEKNGREYSPSQLASIKARIKAAMKKHGIQEGSEEREEKVAATLVALAARQAEAVQAMHHAPTTGKHSHGHLHRVVASEEHYHNNDSNHDGHASDERSLMW